MHGRSLLNLLNLFQTEHTHTHDHNVCLLQPVAQNQCSAWSVAMEMTYPYSSLSLVFAKWKLVMYVRFAHLECRANNELMDVQLEIVYL